MKKLALIIALLGLVAGCSREMPSRRPPIHPNPNMDQQQKFKPQKENDFFADGSSMRMPVPGTVARDRWHSDSAFYYAGRNDDSVLVKRNPERVTMELLERGEGRFNIYCAPCHSRIGDGQGMVVKRGLIAPPSFHDDRLRNVEDGYIFEVITDGKGNMPPYKYQIPVKDRWAIVAYFRALQRSQDATVLDVPTDVRGTL